MSINQQLDPTGLDALVTLCVGDVFPDDVRKGDVTERKLNSILLEPSIGSRVNRVRREKIPFLGSHWK